METKKKDNWNFLDLELDGFIFWNITNFCFSGFASSLLKITKKKKGKQCKSFLSLWLESLISWNTKKTSVRKNIINIFRVFFIFWAWAENCLR